MTAGSRAKSTAKTTAKTSRGRTKARPNTNGAGSNGSRKRADLAKEVASELKTLRASLDEMTEHYRLRSAAQIAELLQAVEGDSEVKVSARGKLPPVNVTQSQLELLKDARLKPRKGRAKDFARLHDLLEELVSLLPAER
jgi:hypothetical protein